MTTRRSLALLGALVFGALCTALACEARCAGSVASAQAPADACTLPTEGRQAREADYRAFLTAHHARLDGVSLRVSLRGDTQALRRRVEAIARAERGCCAPLEIGFEASPEGGTVTVAARGEAGAWTAASVLEALR